MITLLGAYGEDGGRMHGMEENEVRAGVSTTLLGVPWEGGFGRGRKRGEQGKEGRSEVRA